jgi:Protein of unknown function (DUF2878)
MISFFWMQIAWFVCVMGPAHGLPFLGPLVVAGLACVHVRNRPLPVREFAILAFAALLGFAVDTALLRYGVLHSSEGARYAPVWLVALWPNFAMATAAGSALSRLSNRPWLATLAGAVAGPLAYRGGARFAPISLGQPVFRSLLVLAALWALLVPGIFALRKRMFPQ